MGNKRRSSGQRLQKKKFKGVPEWQNAESSQSEVSQSSEEIPISEDIPDGSSTSVDNQDSNTPEFPSFGQPMSISALKLGVPQELHSETEATRPSRACSTTTSDPEVEPQPGNIIVDLQNLKAAMKLMHKCKTGDITVVEDHSKRYGLSSTICFECTSCKHQVTLQTSKKCGQTIEINRRAVYAMSEVGLGREALATICEIMNLPPPVVDSSFQKQNKAINKASIETVEEELQGAATELRKKMMAEDPNITVDSVIDVAVSFDGTWSKRGFTANYGVGFVVAAENGKVLDYAVLSKVCEACKQSSKLKNNPEKLEQWQQTHEASGECEKNFDGSSTAMEKETAKIIWNRSIEKHNLRYVNMVCDGDSKAHTEVWDTYGVCDTCATYERMNKALEEYKTWMNSEAFDKWEADHELGETDCKRVNKLDCIGHVQKRMGKNLLNMAKGKKLSDGKSVGGRSGRLTRGTIDKLQKYYGNAIRSTVDPKAKTQAEVEGVVNNMQNAINAVLHHTVKQPNPDERHKFCPEGSESWCAYQRDKSFEDKNHHLDPVFLDFLAPLFKRLSDSQLLKRCVPGYSQNANESLNALVWNRAPKHRQQGFRFIQTAAASATTHFNSGATGRLATMMKLKIPGNQATNITSKKKDEKRVKQSLARSTKMFQEARAKVRNAKLREEEKRKQKEGVTYQSGAFNEEILSAPLGKKRKKT